MKSVFYNTLAIVIAGFVLFVIAYDHHKQRAIEEPVREHATVIAGAVCDFNPSSTHEYLKAVAMHYNYRQVRVVTDYGQPIVEIHPIEISPFDKKLISLRLIPEVPVSAIIYKQNISLGKIEVIWLNKSIYVYVNVFFVSMLLLAVINMYFRILKDRKTLEDKVFERTEALIDKSEALRESEKKYRSILETSSDWIWETDRCGLFTYASPKVEEILGYTPAEVVGKAAVDFMAPEASAYKAEVLKRISEAGKPIVTIEHIDLHKDGTRVVVETSGEPVFNGDGQLVGYRGVNRDITQRKQAETELNEEKERLRVTLRSIGDGVLTTDMEGRVVLINKVAEQLTEWSLEEAIGKPVETVFNIINEKTGEPCEHPVDRVIDGGEIVGLASDTALISKSGIRYSVEDSGAPIFDNDQRLIGTVLVFRDVTQEKKNAQELLKIKKLQSLGVLAGGIAHDFNNILTAVLGNIELAKMTMSPDARVSRLLENALNAILRARDLTQQLLTFSKGGHPVTQTTAINDIIRDSAEFVLHGTAVSCQLDIPDDLYLVDIDAGQISQVIQNLVLNAIHAMPEGGTITIDCSNVTNIEEEAVIGLPDKTYVKVVVRDTGVGIPEKYLENIFDPYFSNKQEGSGLGLAITHSIIKKHKGYITVWTKENQGTAFSFYIPSSNNPANILTVADDNKKPDTLKKLKILMMDDERAVLKVTGKMFDYLGYEAVFVENGDDAIKTFRQHYHSNHPFDLTIMDLTIPGGKGGIEAVKKLLEIDPEASVIVASGYSNDPVMSDCGRYGFKAALVKPFMITDLSAAIDSVF